MQNIIIDEEFKLYLPKLDKKTFEGLEKSLLEHGVRDSLVVWNDILIDGYNRYSICVKHNIPFTTYSMEFDSREDVLDWIVENQLERRNLTPMELSHFRGVLFNSSKRKKSLGNNQYTEKSGRPQSGGDHSRSATARDLGKRFNVSKNTIERDGRVANAIKAIAEVSIDAKRKILSGEVPVDRSKLQRLSTASKEEIEEVVSQINDGSYNRKDHRISKSPESEPAHEKPGGSNTGARPPQSEANYVDTMVSLIAGNLDSTLKSLTNEGGIPELKTSLRSLINSLEELYRSIE